MAVMVFEGMKELEDALREADLFDDAAAMQDILSAGEAHLSQCIRNEIAKAPYNLKFVSNRLTRNKKVKKDQNGNYYLSVSVSGKNVRGEKNAVVAFVLNYGRAKEYGEIAGSYFWTRAVNKASNSILPVYEKIITEKYREKGLI